MGIPRDIRGLAALVGVWLRAKETEISAVPWALRLGKGLYYFYLHYKLQHTQNHNIYTIAYQSVSHSYIL